MGVLDDYFNAGSQTQTNEPPVSVAEQQQPVVQAQQANEPPETSTEQQQQSNIPTQAAQSAPPVQEPQVDYNAILDKISEGRFKHVDEFKAALPKINEYDNLLQQKTELEAKMAQAPKFANDYVRVFNELVEGGATAEQLNNFQKINSVGDIGELSPKDAIIAKMVLVDGVKESYANRKVEAMYKLSDELLSDEEKEDMQEEMRLASKQAKNDLSKYKADVSKSNVISPEELKLQQAANEAEYAKKLAPQIDYITSQLTKVGTYNLNGKEGAEAVSLDFKYPEDYKPTIQAQLKAYFADGQTPVNDTTIRDAVAYSRAIYLENNIQSMLKTAYEQGSSVTREELVNKYENRSGLKPKEDAPVNNTNQAELTAFMKNVASRGF